MSRPAPRTNAHERGLAMVAVLLVLMALFVLSAPFLVTVRNADQASSEASDRAVLRVALDSAARHAAARLAGSHPALDPTPYFDDLEELTVTSTFPEGFLATRDPRQVMWTAEAEDLAGRIDLASASPHVLANLIGGVARLTEACKESDTALALSGTEGFLPEGVVFVDQEVIGYAELDAARLARLTRGVLVKTDADGKPVECGPSPPRAHDVGAFVLDQRAFALCQWRIATGTLRAYEGLEEVREAGDFLLGPELGREAYLALGRAASTFGQVRAGARWQEPARVLADPAGEPPYGCRLVVDDARWFNPGTTVRITDGDNTELALVREVEGSTLVLAEPLRASFEAKETIVAALVRTPVNVNTATPEVLAALWTNLKLRGRSARITAGEAEKLVDLALVSRPFTGFEDFVRRFVLPAGGLDELPADAPVRPAALEELAREAKLGADGKKTLLGFIDADDARALYKNALNANDGELEFATMPLCFTAREVYGLELRASVNAPSGLERARGERELAELVVPQRDLLSVWTRQEDFDDAPRLDRAGAGWLSGPRPTSRPDMLFGEVSSLRWPTRTRAHLGPHDTQPSVDPLAEPDGPLVYTFAGRESDDGWAQLAPYREQAEARKASWSMHFDDESKVLEGRWLPDGVAPLDLTKLGWSGSGNLMHGMAFSMWVKPRALEAGARLLDVGGQFTDADRLALLVEDNDLVLRVLDAAGDHPLSKSFEEQAEIRFPLGEGPGLPLETWSHVQIAVDGTRPDQMSMWVDGRRAEKTPGLTRLTSALAEDADMIAVESTDGFPDKCVLRIGAELIEARKTGPKTFRATYEQEGENAGFGGRLARELFQGPEVPGQEISLGLFKQTSHPAGTSVMLYGYSLPFFNNVSSAGGGLEAPLGRFAVARAVGIVKGGEQSEDQMEPIESTLNSGDPLLLGWGLDSQDDDVEALVLAAADPGADVSEVMAGFSPSGGYAALLAVRRDFPVTSTLFGTTQITNDKYGVRLGGVEVIRYSRVEGTRLYIDQRGDRVNLPQLSGGNASPDVAGRGAFLFWYNEPFTDTSWSDQNTRLSRQTMVIPISVPAGGTGSGIGAFPPGQAGRSEFAQITRTGSDAHLTEWVRYDDVSSDGQLVRDASDALLAANFAAHAGVLVVEDGGDVRPPAGGGGNGTPGAGRTFLAEPATRSVRARSSPRAQGGQSMWNYKIGSTEDEDFFVTRAVASHLQFRGVMGSYSHAQPAGVSVLPVFKLRDLDETAGWPGRFDHVTLFFEDPTDPGFPAVVQRAHRPFEYTLFFWQESGAMGAAEGDEPENVAQVGMTLGVTYAALQAPLKVFIAASPIGDPENPTDNRLLARMTLFPSGELPREVVNGQLGGDARSKTGVPSAVVDEALFFPSLFTSLAGMPGQLVLERDISAGDTSFKAEEDVLRTTQGDWAMKSNVLAGLPEHGGLLRLGDELLAYESYDQGSFTFTLPTGGRGLCGTLPQPHRTGESISYVSSVPLGILGASVDGDDELLPLLEPPPGFPSHGLVRIEDELVHYSSIDGAVLEMPRGSAEPGALDRKGPGLFRGRFGTQRASHASGTPVVLFPFRYWDRWSELADAPELTFYQLACDQPDAFWKRVFWKVGDAGQPGPELGVLQRTNPDTPWDAKPEGGNGLQLLWQGKLDAEGNAIGVQSDRVEWRVFVRYLPASFDPLAGLAHGWKATPRLELFGVEYMGPSRTLARIDR